MERGVIDTMESICRKLLQYWIRGNLHSDNDTDDSDHEEDSAQQIITLKTEDVEEEIDHSKKIDLEIDKNLDVFIWTDKK